MEEQEQQAVIHEPSQKPKSAGKTVLRILSYVLTVVLTAVITLHASGFSMKEVYLKAIIRSFYDGEVDNAKMQEGSLSGIVAALGDPHSYYIPQAYGYDMFQESITGEYAGIGVEITADAQGVYITRVFPNTPAEKGGLQKGDYVVAVDGEPIDGTDTQQVSDKVRGKVGSSVTVEVLRNGETVSATMTREKVATPTVVAEVLEGNIGYIQIAQFDADTDEELFAALDGMENIEGVILDLRDNPGGLFDVCMATIDPFLSGGDMVIARYKDKEETEHADENVAYTMPMVVLINENSASSSEIFAACMKDNKRATLVGTTSYGKGSIQRTFVAGDNSAMNLTIGHFYSPLGTKIDGVGVEPHIKVEYKTEDGAQYDSQLQAAIQALKK